MSFTNIDGSTITEATSVAATDTLIVSQGGLVKTALVNLLPSSGSTGLTTAQADSRYLTTAQTSSIVENYGYLTEALTTAQADSRYLTTAEGIYLDVDTITDTSHVFTAGDDNKFLKYTAATSVIVSVPTCSEVAFQIGTQLAGVQMGAGQLVFTSTSGVTIRTTETQKTRKQYSGWALTKVAADEWLLTGDTEVST